MYRRPKFLTVLHKIREAMSREADYDVDLFAEMVRAGTQPTHGPRRNIRGLRRHQDARLKAIAERSLESGELGPEAPTDE